MTGLQCMREVLVISFPELPFVSWLLLGKCEQMCIHSDRALVTYQINNFIQVSTSEFLEHRWMVIEVKPSASSKSLPSLGDSSQMLHTCCLLNNLQRVPPITESPLCTSCPCFYNHGDQPYKCCISGAHWACKFPSLPEPCKFLDSCSSFYFLSLVSSLYLLNLVSSPYPLSLVDPPCSLSLVNSLYFLSLLSFHYSLSLVNSLCSLSLVISLYFLILLSSLYFLSLISFPPLSRRGYFS